MIVFDLSCGNAHVFEAWFGSSADYEDQQARGLVACPVCDDHRVTKALMTPAIPAKGNRRAKPAQTSDDAPAQAAEGGSLKDFMKSMAEAQAKLTEGSDYVGDRFAAEARAIHHGEVDKRSIHGETTRAEAAKLADEGVQVMPLPFRTRPADA